MPTVPDTYRLRADEARTEAGEASLDNVRDIHLRAAAAWDAMAARAGRTQRRRAEEQAAKAARDAAGEAAETHSHAPSDGLDAGGG